MDSVVQCKGGGLKTLGDFAIILTKFNKKYYKFKKINVEGHEKSIGVSTEVQKNFHDPLRKN